MLRQPALFAAAWMGWCLLHSLLIAGPPARGLEKLFPRTHRLVYNLIAFVTLLPLLLWEWQVAADPVYRWPFLLWPLRVLLLAVAVYLVVSAARAFDMLVFLGISGLRSRTGQPAEPEVLRTDGILARLRHPWYAAGLILIWLRDQHLYSLLGSLVLTGYLLVGALLEERRMLRRFGASYAIYREQVPRFFPRIQRNR